MNTFCYCGRCASLWLEKELLVFFVDAGFFRPRGRCALLVFAGRGGVRGAEGHRGCYQCANGVATRRMYQWWNGQTLAFGERRVPPIVPSAGDNTKGKEAFVKSGCGGMTSKERLSCERSRTVRGCGGMGGSK